MRDPTTSRAMAFIVVLGIAAIIWFGWTVYQIAAGAVSSYAEHLETLAIPPDQEKFD